MFRRTLLPILLAWSLLPGALPARAEDDERGGPTPPRLSYLDGEVSFWRPGAEDWAPAHINTPLAEGDSLFTGSGANAEVQIGGGAFARAGENTELGVDGIEQDFLQLKLTSGHAALDLRRLPSGQRVEVDTPAAAITIDDEGYYRIIVGEAGTKVITRRGGSATITPPGGERTDVPEGTEASIEGDGSVHTQPAPDLDEWDRWNYDRGAPRQAPARRYVPDDVYGADELESNGTWRSEPEYGQVWYPHAVAADWAPYTAGRWLWDPFYGWSWVDDAPWGWAPFHYGRWVHVGPSWGWAPGPIVTTAVYAPALVAFLGPVTVSVGAPIVSWVALGWGEPCLPWWGRAHYGRPWWGGWGGPRTVINVHNVNVYNVYRNTHVRNAIVAERRDGFGRGGRLRLSDDDVRHLRPVSHFDVKPRPDNLTPREGHARRPPDDIRNRSVVSTRAPRDPSRRLQAEGLPVRPNEGNPQHRVVEAPARRHGGAPVRPGGVETPDRGDRQGGGPRPGPHGNQDTGAPQERAWRGAHPDRPQPPPPPRHDVGEARPRHQHEAPASDAGRMPRAQTPAEPRQGPRGDQPDRQFRGNQPDRQFRGNQPDRQPRGGQFEPGGRQQPPPPPRVTAPEVPRAPREMQQRRDAMPQREMGGQPQAPQVQAPHGGQGGGNEHNGAERHRHGHEGEGAAPRRFAPPPPPPGAYRGRGDVPRFAGRAPRERTGGGPTWRSGREYRPSHAFAPRNFSRPAHGDGGRARSYGARPHGRGHARG